MILVLQNLRTLLAVYAFKIHFRPSCIVNLTALQFLISPNIHIIHIERNSHGIFCPAHIYVYFLYIHYLYIYIYIYTLYRLLKAVGRNTSVFSFFPLHGAYPATTSVISRGAGGLGVGTGGYQKKSIIFDDVMIANNRSICLKELWPMQNINGRPTMLHV